MKNKRVMDLVEVTDLVFSFQGNGMSELLQGSPPARMREF